MSTAPNMPSHLEICRCDDCFCDVPSGSELCEPCRAAGCEVEGGRCKADRVDVEVHRHATSQAGLELARYGFVATHQGGGLVNFEGTLGGLPAQILIDSEDDGWGPTSLHDPVILVRWKDADYSENEDTSYPTLNALVAALPRPE